MQVMTGLEFALCLVVGMKPALLIRTLTPRKLLFDLRNEILNTFIVCDVQFTVPNLRVLRML